MATKKKGNLIETGKNQKAGIKERYEAMEAAREYYELQQTRFGDYNQSILDGYDLTGRWIVNEDFNLSKEPAPAPSQEDENK